MTKDFPPITDDIRRPRINVALKPREISDEAAEEQSRVIAQKRQAYGQPPEPPGVKLNGMRVYIPDYVDRAVNIAAAERGVTKSYVILQALEQAGFRVDPADLVADRRKERGNKA